MTRSVSDTSERRRIGILPREQGAVSLDLVIGVMAFLAALALGGVLIANRSADSGQAGLAGRLRVQILPQGQAAPEKEVDAAVKLLQSTPGVVYAGTLSDADNLALVEPWLGRASIVTALPFPKLIDVRLAPGATPDIARLEMRLTPPSPHPAPHHPPHRRPRPK